MAHAEASARYCTVTGRNCCPTLRFFGLEHERETDAQCATILRDRGLHMFLGA